MNLFLRSITYTQIILVSLGLFFIFITVSRVGTLTIYKCYHAMRASKTIFCVLILLQFVLTFYLPAYRNVILIYAFLLLVGVNLYSLLTPKFLKGKFSCFVWIPLNGLILASLLGSYFIGFNIKIVFLAPTLLCIVLILTIIQLTLSKNSLIAAFEELKVDYRSVLLIYTFIMTPIICCLIFPVLQSSFPTSAYRVGPDLFSYAKMAQFFIDGGRWLDAVHRAHDYSGLSITAINQVSDAMLDWPVIYYFRWGLTAYHSLASAVTFTHHAYETLFVSMVIPHLLLAGLVLIWLVNQFRLNPVVASLGALAFVFNANLINLWYEGFYGNSFSLVFFAAILYVFLHLRNKEQDLKNDLVRPFLFMSLLIAVCLSSYTESAAVLLIFMGFIGLVDLILTKSVYWPVYLMLLMSLILGIWLVLPCGFFMKWAGLAHRQLTEAGGNGYPQPLWALPSDILGFRSIYLSIPEHQYGQLISRYPLNLWMTLGFSGFVLYLVVNYLRKNRNSSTIGYVASLLMVVFSACYVYHRMPLNNYMYMKMYVIQMPFLFVIFWFTLASFAHKQTIRKIDIMNNPFHVGTLGFLANIFKVDHSKFVNKMCLFFAILIVMNGLVYITQYKNQSFLIDNTNIALHDDLKQVNFDKVVIYPFFIVVPHKYSLEEYSAIFPQVLWLKRDWIAGYANHKSFFNHFANYKVYLFTEKSFISSLWIYKNIVYEDADYFIMDSGKVIKDGLVTKDNFINLDAYVKMGNHKSYSQRLFNENIRQYGDYTGIWDSFPRFFAWEPESNALVLLNGTNRFQRLRTSSSNKLAQLQ